MLANLSKSVTEQLSWCIRTEGRPARRNLALFAGAMVLLPTALFK